MNKKTRSFQTKLRLLMIAGLVVLQAATLVAVHLAGRRAVQQTVSDELRVGARVLARVLESRGQQLAATASVLTADFAFREVVASGDRPTITSVLRNHGERIAADAVFLISLDGTVDADTLDNRFVDTPFPVRDLFASAQSGEPTSAISSFEHRAHQFVVVPVLAPVPIAYVGIGFAIDDKTLEEVRRLTSLHYSLLRASAGEREPVLASTLAGPARAELAQRVRALSPSSFAAPATLAMDSQSYATVIEPLLPGNEGDMQVVLQVSIDRARRAFRRLELQIFGLSTLALMGSLVGVTFLARGISLPLQRLAERAQGIGAGDYTATIEIGAQDELGQLASAFNQMQSGIREREEQIRHQATHDSLTGLPNRTLFLDRVQLAIDRARRQGGMVGMVMMDLDRFKEINDTLGHHFGDVVLCEIGRRLLAKVRASDTIARLGGDEFAVLFDTADPPGALEIARRVSTILEAPFAIGDLSIAVTASLGISLFPLHADDPGTLMKRADIAMYDAKKNNLATSMYESGRDDHSLRRLSILSELRQAISGSQLEVHYQPKVDFTTGRAVAAEALVRWQHPVHGPMPPGEFVPLAEQSGDIRMLTRWVLERAVTDCARWNREGLDLSVAVNLSALDLYDSQLPSVIEGLLRASGLEPTRLLVEITESAVMKDASHAGKILGELKDQGIVISIDDFGTGYSSLAHLRRLPVDELKIDRSFVIDLREEGREDLMIVRSTIELGHNMGLKVIAEGVESLETWKVLAKLGCDLAQGYFISRPMPSPQFEAWMRGAPWTPESSVVGRPG